MESPPPTKLSRLIAPLPGVESGGVTLQRGDRVRVRSRAGTIKPAECGPTIELEIELDEGHAGPPHVDLPSFASTIHGSYLELA